MGLVQVATTVSDGSATFLEVTGINTDHVYLVAYTLIRTTLIPLSFNSEIIMGQISDSTKKTLDGFQ